MAGVAGVALLSVAAPAAFAQNASTNANTSAASGEETTTVIVTAQKREQKLQDVPIVVTTLSGKLLQDAGVHDIKDMQILTPGLIVTSTENESQTTARIRGVGTVGDNPGLESSVGVVIDGVYRPRNGVGFEDLGELERIEVLKGPQGTLFGKNTSAGVINIITKKPAFTFGADGEVTYGNFGNRGYGVSVTGPIVADKLAGRLYVAHRQHDGYEDVITGVGPRTRTSDGNGDFDTARGQLLFVPNAESDIRLIADYTDRKEACCAAVQSHLGPTAAIINALSGNRGIATTANPKALVAYSNRDTDQRIRDSGISLEGNFKLPGFFDSTLTTITAARDWKTTSGQDLDYTGADVLYRPNNGDYNTRFKTLTEEVRLAGQTEHSTWLVGGFFSQEDLYRHDTYVYGSVYEPYIGLLLSSGADPTMVSKFTGKPYGSNFVAGQGAKDAYTQGDKSYAFFTNDSWKFSDAFEVTAGLRYTHETKTLNAAYSDTDGGAACGAAMTNFGTAKALLTAYGTPTGAITHGANPYWVGALAAGSAPTALGAICPFWANPYFNGRTVHDSKAESNLSGTLKGSWHLNPDEMIYVSYARGYKAGGYNLDRANTSLVPDSSLWFAPETVDSAELGFKSNLFGHSLAFDITAFDQKFKNFQLNTFLGTAFVVESIPSLTSKGIDADIYWKTPVPGLSVQGGVSYADTKYGQFTAADLANPSHFPGLSLLPGAQVSFAPKWTSSLALSWSKSWGDLRTTANLTGKYSSSYNTGSDLVPYKAQDSYTLLNARFGIGAINQRWT
ncbi:MAG: TonB-dependent receptor, partial [Asticcacaulis sp.]